MTKSQLIELLIEKAQLTKKQSESVINIIIDSLSNSLANGQRIEIRGFGAFSVRNYKSYNGRNPKTGENVVVNGKRLPFFKVGKDMKLRVDHV
jgi:integration host factor subunit beta